MWIVKNDSCCFLSINYLWKFYNFIFDKFLVERMINHMRNNWWPLRDEWTQRNVCFTPTYFIFDIFLIGDIWSIRLVIAAAEFQLSLKPVQKLDLIINNWSLWVILSFLCLSYRDWNLGFREQCGWSEQWQNIEVILQKANEFNFQQCTKEIRQVT